MLSNQDLEKKLKALAVAKPPEVVLAEELVAAGYTVATLHEQIQSVGVVKGATPSLYLEVANCVRDIIKYGKVIPKNSVY